MRAFYAALLSRVLTGVSGGANIAENVRRTPTVARARVQLCNFRELFKLQRAQER
jgi:hypothetical protein